MQVVYIIIVSTVCKYLITGGHLVSKRRDIALEVGVVERSVVEVTRLEEIVEL